MIESTTEDVLLDLEDKVLTITLNRPDKLNALSGATYASLFELHQDDHAHLMSRVTIDLGASREDVPTDQRVEAYSRLQRDGAELASLRRNA